MGVTKTDLFSKDQNTMSAYAKVLAHPARIAILEFLLKSKSCCNSNLVNELGLSQPTISQHLKEMKSIGILKGTVEGVSVNYCINPEKWKEIQNVFDQFFNSYQLEDFSSSC